MQRRGQETQKWTLKGLGTYQLPVDLYAVVTERQFSLSEKDTGSPHYFMSNFMQRVGQRAV